MRFESLSVNNLRAVREFAIDELKDFVVIAGPNGCGKSCVFDAMRLLKSVYGGYSTDEYMQWFGERAINPQDRAALRRMFRDPNRPVSIIAQISFASSERDFLIARAADLLWPIAWQRVTGQRLDYWTFNRIAIATQLGQHREAVEQAVAQLQADLQTALTVLTHTLSLEIRPDGTLFTARCLPAEVSFQAYEPGDLGIIEYHSASRAYTRQPLQGINLDARAFADQRRQQTLYNWQAKYQNVKTELATGYLRNLIAAESGGQLDGEDLNATLKELFKTFFPDKVYEGVRPLPEGSLEFPVLLPGGERHDIDDLSSGEKEILYGYLRLRNSTPRRSVILLDEPELHLNPSLLQGFADFYYRHLGVAQGNQLWLVTHSDTLLRQAIGNSNYRVFHMLTATTHTSGNQGREVLLDDDVERVVVDLVGDLAAYRPHAKVLILEGTSEDGFDEAFIRRLFPHVVKQVNLVSAGSKRRVRDLYAVLARSIEQVGMPNRFFAIVDKDTEAYSDGAGAGGAQVFMWDVYHVENYLLVPSAIREACESLLAADMFGSDAAVLGALKQAATELVPGLILEQIRTEVNADIVGSIDIGASPESVKPAKDLLPSIKSSVDRVIAKGDAWTATKLEARVTELRSEFETALESDQWIRDFPGRRILQRFVRDHAGGSTYESFRNVVMDKLAVSEIRPASAAAVLDRIAAA